MEQAKKPTEGAQSGNKRNLYLILIIILILLNGFFAFNHWSAKQEVAKVEAERNELDSLYTDVLADLNEQQMRLDTLKGRNSEMDSVIRVKTAELEQYKAEIEELMRKKKLTDSELYNLKKKIKSLQAENTRFIAQLDSLTTQVALLTSVNDSLNMDLGMERALNEQLLTEKGMLSEKVALGSLLKPENVKITGVKYRSNGKEIEVDRSKKAEKLKICFDVPENKVAEHGKKTIMVRILSPEGSTIAVEAEGSGIFMMNETGEQKQYTMKADFSYEGKPKNLCLYWSQTSPYSKGEYKAIFYQNGYQLKEVPFDLN